MPIFLRIYTESSQTLTNRGYLIYDTVTLFSRTAWWSYTKETMIIEDRSLASYAELVTL